MGKICCVCEKENSGLFSAKCDDGLICRNCISSFLTVVSAKDYRSHTIRSLIAYEKELAEEFVCTSHIGKIYIDEIHNLIAYHRSGRKNPEKFCDIFRISDLKELQISITEPKVNGKRLCCDMIFTVHMASYPVFFQKVLKRNLVCNYERIDSKTVSYEMPSEYVAVKFLFSKIIKNCIHKQQSELDYLKDVRKLKEQEIEKIKHLDEAKIKSSGGADKVKATGMLYLEKNYSGDEVKKNYKILARLFHPDLNNKTPDVFMKKLNEAYEILKKE